MGSERDRKVREGERVSYYSQLADAASGEMLAAEGSRGQLRAGRLSRRLLPVSQCSSRYRPDFCRRAGREGEKNGFGAKSRSLVGYMNGASLSNVSNGAPRTVDLRWSRPVRASIPKGGTSSTESKESGLFWVSCSCADEAALELSVLEADPGHARRLDTSWEASRAESVSPATAP